MSKFLKICLTIYLQTFQRLEHLGDQGKAAFEPLIAHQKALESLDSKALFFSQHPPKSRNYHLFITTDQFGFDDTQPQHIAYCTLILIVFLAPFTAIA